VVRDFPATATGQDIFNTICNGQPAPDGCEGRAIACATAPRYPTTGPHYQADVEWGCDPVTGQNVINLTGNGLFPAGPPASRNKFPRAVTGKIVTYRNLNGGAQRQALFDYLRNIDFNQRLTRIAAYDDLQQEILNHERVHERQQKAYIDRVEDIYNSPNTPSSLPVGGCIVDPQFLFLPYLIQDTLERIAEAVGAYADCSNAFHRIHTGDLSPPNRCLCAGDCGAYDPTNYRIPDFSDVRCPILEDR